MLRLQNEREWAMFCEKVLLQLGLAQDPRYDRTRSALPSGPRLTL